MMIFFVPQDGTCAVQLLCQQESYQLVRKGELGQRPSKTGSVEHSFIKAVNTADEEYQALRAFIGAQLNKFRQAFRSHFPAPLVQRHEVIVFR